MVVLLTSLVLCPRLLVVPSPLLRNNGRAPQSTPINRRHVPPPPLVLPTHRFHRDAPPNVNVVQLITIGSLVLTTGILLARQPIALCVIVLVIAPVSVYQVAKCPSFPALHVDLSDTGNETAPLHLLNLESISCQRWHPQSTTSHSIVLSAPRCSQVIMMNDVKLSFNVLRCPNY